MNVNIPTHLDYHPIANEFPLIDGGEYDELVNSIKASGLHDTITTLDGMILDGRNRYRACLDAGVEPRTSPLDEDIDPLAFVIIKNVHRRHLTVGQRALAVAKLATLSNGQTKRNLAGPKSPACRTIDEVAAMAGVGRQAIKHARTLNACGTDEEIAAVKAGAVSISTTAEKVAARREKKPPPGLPGNPAAVPAGKKLTELAQQGIALERRGERFPAVAKKLGLSDRAYKLARDGVLLVDRDDLSREEHRAVVKALRDLDQTARLDPAQKIIDPIGRRVFGYKGGRINKTKKSGNRLNAQFENAITFLQNTCENAVGLLIPATITKHEADKAIERLCAAEASLRELIVRIKGETK